jgi:hypothetical protein
MYRKSLQNVACKYVVPGYCRAFPGEMVTTNEVTGVGRDLNIGITLIPCIKSLEVSIIGQKFSKKSTYGAFSGSNLQVLVYPFFEYAPFEPGTYTVTATPNGNARKAKSFKFIV